MSTAADVLLVFPASLYGGRWADGPAVKPELVQLASELRRAGHRVDVLDLEVELGNPADGAARDAFLTVADGLLAARAADLVFISAWSALQYSAAVAVARRVRAHHPAAVVAVGGHHPSVRPGDFLAHEGLFDWVVTGETELAVVELAGMLAAGRRPQPGCAVVEGPPLPLDAGHRPDFAAYPYAHEGIEELPLFLSRGCPYNAPACLLRPGGGGWRAFPPAVALEVVAAGLALRPRRLSVLDPAFGYDPGWRRATLSGLAAADRRGATVGISSRPPALTRDDVDGIYAARLQLRLEVGTLSPTLLARRREVPYPSRAVAHALDLLAYLNAKGVRTFVGLTFNQPGETRETAQETLDALERFVSEAPNSSLTLEADGWSFLPGGDPEADVEAPRRLFGTRIEHPEWWKEAGDARALATAVVASRELADLPPGDDSYWRPRFEELAARLEAKLTAEARRGLRSHEVYGAEAYGVPHGWWREPRWH